MGLGLSGDSLDGCLRVWDAMLRHGGLRLACWGQAVSREEEAVLASRKACLLPLILSPVELATPAGAKQ